MLHLLSIVLPILASVIFRSQST